MTVKTAIKASMPYIKEGNYEKVWKILDGETDEAGFISHISPANINKHTLKFIATFEQPDWFAIMDKTVQKMPDLMHFFKTADIQMHKKNEGGETLACMFVKKIILDYNLYDLLYNLDEAWLRKDFIANPDSILKQVSSQLIKENKNEHEDWRLMNFLNKAFNHPEVRQSENYANLFKENSLYAKKQVNEENSIVSILPEKLDKNEKDRYESSNLLNNFLMYRLSIEDKRTQAMVASIQQKLDDDSFNPDMNLLSKQAKKLFKMACFEEPEVIAFVKKLTEKNIINLQDANELKHPNFFGNQETWLLNVINHRIDYYPARSENKLSEMDMTLDIAEKLKEMGFEAKMDKAAYSNLQYRIESHMDYCEVWSEPKNKYSSEIEALAEKLKLPLAFIPDAIEFINKKHQENIEQSIEQKLMAFKEFEKGVQSRWDAFMADVQVLEKTQDNINSNNINPQTNTSKAVKP
jgi:hypothetical protein